MAKKKDPYGRIRERFVDARLEDRGFEELDVEQRERVSNRFNVLAQTVEGRGKIAAQVLGENANPENTKALRQRLRANLPQKTNSKLADDDNPSIVSPASRVRPVGGDYTPASSKSQTATRSTVVVAASKQSNRSVLQKIDDAQFGIGQAIRKVTDPVSNYIMPAGAQDRAKLKGSRAQNFSLPGVGETARIALDAFYVAGLAPATIKVGTRAVTGIAGLGKYVAPLGRKLTGGKPPRPSPDLSVSPAPVVRPTAPTRPSATTGTATRRTSAVTPEPVVTPTPEVAQTPTTSESMLAKNREFNQARAKEQALAKRNKGPRVSNKFAEPAPVALGSQPPTTMQATVTPEVVVPTAPVAPPAPAPKFVSAPKDLPRAERSALNKANYAKIQADARTARAAEKAANPKPPKPKKEKKPKAETKFFDQPTGTPPPEGVVGGATPKVIPDPVGISSPPTPPSLPKNTASKKSPTSTPDQPVVGKPAANRKRSGQGETDLELQRRFPEEVVEYKEYPDPSMKTGVAKKTTFKSQAVSRREAELSKAAKPKVEFFDGNNKVAPAEKPNIVMFKDTVDAKGISYRDLVDPRAKAIQDSMLPFDKNARQGADSFSTQNAIQDRAAEAARRSERFDPTPRRKTPRQRQKLIDQQTGPQLSSETETTYIRRVQKITKDVDQQIQLETQRRPPSQRASVKTRRINKTQTRKAMNEQRKFEEARVSEIEIKGITGDDKADAASNLAEALLDPRSSQQIQVDINLKVQNVLNQPPPAQTVKPKTKAQIKEQNRIRESVARLKDPAEVQAQRTAEKAKQKYLEEIQVRANRLSTASGRNKLRKEIAAANVKGKRVNDNTPGLRQTVAEDPPNKRRNAEGEIVNTRARDTLDQIFQGDGSFRSTPVETSYRLPPPETPRPPSITYAERGQPASLTYEDLLRIESQTFVDSRMTPGLSISKDAQLKFAAQNPRPAYQYVIDRQPKNIATRTSRSTKGAATRGSFRPTTNSPGTSGTALRSTNVTKADLVEMMQGSLKRMDDSARKAKK